MNTDRLLQPAPWWWDPVHALSHRRAVLAVRSWGALLMCGCTVCQGILKWGAQEKSSFLNGWNVFCTTHSDFGNTCWLQQGYEFTLLSRLSFIFMTNVIMLLTFLTFLQIISLPFFLCFISFVWKGLHVQEKIISRCRVSVPEHWHGAPASLSSQG